MLKSKVTPRDWREARRKLLRESQCRVCKSQSGLECAHTISRELQDVEVEGPRGGTRLLVKADAIVPLCQKHHMAYDARQLDIVPYLTRAEERCAVETVGLVRAYKRLSGPNG